MQSQAAVAHKHTLSTFVNSHSQTATYLDIGNGPPLLLLHGFFGEKTCWLPLIELLQSQFRCISLDMLGFGESSKPQIQYDVAVEVAFVRQVVQQLNIEPCGIIGHSFGGWVASAYALKYPKSVSSLVLAAPAGIRDDSFCGQYDALRPLLWETPAVDWALQLAKPFARLAGKSEKLQEISGWRRELMYQPVARSFLMSRMRPEDAVDTVEKEIHKLQIPTLVIAADSDETIPLWHCQTYANEIPGAELAIIPNATHGLPQTQAQIIAKLISKFLDN
ncbi:MAG: alpha/beta hydrolase [Microcoleus sp. PH2017_25_DOB_D_A]|uniref:alpha/beta fold hydrolase n=1 Tax=unclassified Microcoleus TaxID=2642155 RepID=UPI001DCCB849|nr:MULTISPECIES: alpha/beta hydrolase [unclassified Microcoleus]TAE43134.1 MAG: alpha/beta hydrolase [Oscillatoriales cyanobacterium]MCC3452562.1 alpha/beta hydrolase [Microcoleus sp. PH2017_08_TRC_O_A]MCC3493948.1 alpha/beta hydrolase [Microcoleus sp. PH2017_16_JOR_D_A]MCC3533808.1 alpha/beta hydrolase [Microcoleus sp. PH2017_25_DOB_D_A]MCC3548554.1 alpha/beta hydrolase [Microcoleus sp. PH2017_24_DOB_U_A]